MKYFFTISQNCRSCIFSFVKLAYLKESSKLTISLSIEKGWKYMVQHNQGYLHLHSWSLATVMLLKYLFMFSIRIYFFSTDHQYIVLMVSKASTIFLPWRSKLEMFRFYRGKNDWPKIDQLFLIITSQNIENPAEIQKFFHELEFMFMLSG